MSQNLKKFATLAEADPYWIAAGREQTPVVPGAKFTRKLDQYDARYAETFVALMDAQTTITSPVCDNVTRSGTYAHSTTIARAEDDRSVTITDTLTLVSSVSSVSDLAALTPYITQDHKIINLFGFETGEGENILYVYPNINPNTRLTCEMISDASLKSSIAEKGFLAWPPANHSAISVNAIYTSSAIDYICILAYTYGDGVGETQVAPASDTTHWVVYPDWSYADRKWKQEENGTATFAILFRRAIWSKAWGTANPAVAGDERKMGDANSAGWGRRVTQSVNGVPIANRATLLTNMLGTTSGKDTYVVTLDGVDYVTQQISLSEDEAQIAASKQMGVVFQGTAESDATVIQLKADIGRGPPALIRVWRRRSAAAKTTLTTAGSGKAVSNATTPSAYTHAEVEIQDNGDSTFDVVQTCVDATGLAAGETFYTTSRPVKKYLFRSKDAKVLIVSYTHLITVKATAKKAQDYITYADGTGAVDTYRSNIEKNSTKLVREGPFRYRAECFIYVGPTTADWT